MVEPARTNSTHYTYADLRNWPEEERWELIDGVAFEMTPAPSLRHQQILRELVLQFGNFLEGTPCQVFFAPFDVRLPKAGENAMTATTVVQPDLSVVCESEKLDEHGCAGSPTLVVEILSPRTVQRDLRAKLLAYELAGSGCHVLLDHM